MATYTETSNSLVCMGSHISSSGLLAHININPHLGSAMATYHPTISHRPVFVFSLEIPMLQVGDGTDRVAIWNPLREDIVLISHALKLHGPGAALILGSNRLDQVDYGCLFTHVSLAPVWCPPAKSRGAVFKTYNSTIHLTGVPEPSPSPFRVIAP